MQIEIASIKTSRWRRPTDSAKVAALAKSIKDLGLLNPITVNAEMELIAGMHRLEAMQGLGILSIEANVADLDDIKAELASIDENIVRNNPEYMERADMLKRRKELYEELYPSTKQGAIGNGRVVESTTQRFTADTAEKTGVSESTVRQEVQLATNIIPELKAAITSEAVPKIEALQIARMAPEEQKEIAAAVAQGETVREALKPHVSNNSGNNEWYTPADYIEAARRVMGGIDTDPASSEIANKTVQATTFFTAESNGLQQEWSGRVWMNPPYAQPLIAQFCEAVTTKFEHKEITEAMILVNNATETGWFQRLLEQASAVCFVKSRIKFLDPEGKPGAPLQGQCLLYFGDNVDGFSKGFFEFGKVLQA